MMDVHQAEEPLAGLRPPDHARAQEGTLPMPNRENGQGTTVGVGVGNQLTPAPVSWHTWGASVRVQTHRLHCQKEPAFF